MDYVCVLSLGIFGVIVLGLTVIFHNYKAKMSKKGIELEKNDLEHERKHLINEQKIKELEKKNGTEQRQIDELKKELAKVKKKINW